MTRTIVFGAFDRHNVGDLLFPHVLAALLPGQELVFAGLVDRDLTPYGGHRVHAVSRLAEDTRATNLVVAGGEVLTCEAWEAAVMVLPDDQARAAAARLARAPEGREAWAQAVLGSARHAPYAPAKSLLAWPARLVYNAVGGADLPTRHEATREEVVAALRSADVVDVRDVATRAALAAQGITAGLVPDCAALAEELFAAPISDAALRGEPAAVGAAFAKGYVAVQFSADFEDDATVETVARELDVVAQRTGLGIVFFRAGMAPWHDALEPYMRTAKRMRSRVHLFRSAHVRDICALIAGSRAVAGTSLHARILATAFARPRVTLANPVSIAANGAGKQHAYVATWETPEQPGVVAPRDLAAAIVDALRANPQRLAEHGARLAALSRQGIARWAAILDKSG